MLCVKDFIWSFSKGREEKRVLSWNITFGLTLLGIFNLFCLITHWLEKILTFLSLLLKQCHGILCLMVKLWRCYLQVCAAPSTGTNKTTGLLSSTSENLDLKKAKKCVKGRGWGLIVTKSCWPQLPGQSCDGPRDLLKGWRLVNPWNTPWTKEGFGTA